MIRKDPMAIPLKRGFHYYFIVDGIRVWFPLGGPMIRLRVVLWYFSGWFYGTPPGGLMVPLRMVLGHRRLYCDRRLQKMALSCRFGKRTDKILYEKLRYKFVNADSDLVEGFDYIIDLTFEPHCIADEGDEPTQGHYSKRSTAQSFKFPPGLEIAVYDDK